MIETRSIVKLRNFTTPPYPVSVHSSDAEKFLIIAEYFVDLVLMPLVSAK